MAKKLRALGSINIASNNISRTHNVRAHLCPLIILIAVFSSPVFAQENNDPRRSLPSSQININKVNNSKTIRFEHETKTTIEIPAIEFMSCQANISLSYHQRNTLARVNAIIENQNCTASNGTYEIAISIRDENGDAQTLSFDESWQQTSSDTINVTKDYKIGNNIDLRRVQARSVDCTCEVTSVKTDP